MVFVVHFLSLKRNFEDIVYHFQQQVPVLFLIIQGRSTFPIIQKYCLHFQRQVPVLFVMIQGRRRYFSYN
jgi:hypothetical protein